MHFETHCMRLLRRRLKTPEFFRFCCAGCFGIGSCMKFDRRRTDAMRCVQLPRIGIDKQCHLNSRFLQPLHERRQAALSAVVANLTLAPAVPTGTPVASALGTGKSVQVELSWAAPAQPVPVEFFVQVLAMDTDRAHRVFASFSKRSAVLVLLPRVPADYAWRIYTVAAPVHDYAPSAWSYFSIR
jgi:hypothetical protein